jgi:hypothetical protein
VKYQAETAYISVEEVLRYIPSASHNLVVIDRCDHILVNPEGLIQVEIRGNRMGFIGGKQIHHLNLATYIVDIALKINAAPERFRELASAIDAACAAMANFLDRPSAVTQAAHTAASRAAHMAVVAWSSHDA